MESHLITLSIHYDTQQNSRYFWSSPSDRHFSKHSKTGKNTIYVRKYYFLQTALKSYVSETDRYEDLWQKLFQDPFIVLETKGIFINPVVLQWLWPFWTQKGLKRGVKKMGVLYLVLKNLPPKLNCTVMDINLAALFQRCKNMVLILFYSLRLTNWQSSWHNISSNWW